MTAQLSRLNGNLKPALIGAMITAILGLSAWGASDRLSYEARIVRLESAADTATVERERILQSIQRIENKLDILSRDLRSNE